MCPPPTSCLPATTYLTPSDATVRRHLFLSSAILTAHHEERRRRQQAAQVGRCPTPANAFPAILVPVCMCGDASLAARVTKCLSLSGVALLFYRARGCRQREGTINHDAGRSAPRVERWHACQLPAGVLHLHAVMAAQLLFNPFAPSVTASLAHSQAKGAGHALGCGKGRARPCQARHICFRYHMQLQSSSIEEVSV